MTALALICRPIVGMTEKRPISKGIDLILIRRPTTGTSTDFMYWYYGSRALATHAGSSRTAKQWGRELVLALLSEETRDDAADGSWYCQSPWSDVGGRVYCTALSILMLCQVTR